MRRPRAIFTNIDSVTVWVAVGSITIVALPILVAVLTSMKAGSAADWVAAIATLAALFAAVVAARLALRTYALERERDAERQRERRAAQADQVAVWAIEGVNWRGGFVTESFGPEGHTRSQEAVPVVPSSLPVVIRNDSHLPVHDLRVEVYFREKGGGASVYSCATTAVPVVPPRTSREVEVVSPALEKMMRATLADSREPGGTSRHHDRLGFQGQRRNRLATHSRSTRTARGPQK